MFAMQPIQLIVLTSVTVISFTAAMSEQHPHSALHMSRLEDSHVSVVTKQFIKRVKLKCVSNSHQAPIKILVVSRGSQNGLIVRLAR